MTAEFAAVALHRPSRPENIGGVLRAADVYGAELVVLGGGSAARLAAALAGESPVGVILSLTP